MSGLFNNQNQLQVFINETISDNLSKKFVPIKIEYLPLFVLIPNLALII